MRKPKLVQRVLAALLLMSFAACAGGSQATEETASAETSSGQTAGEAVMNAEPSRPAAARPAPTVLPEGKAIVVRLDHALGSKISDPGDTFTATVAEPVTVNGKVVIPAGAQASGTVTNAKPLGRLAGEAVLSIRLNSISSGGKTYELQTAVVTRIAKGKGKRTAATIGGGAGAGALIGGLVGGGKGALIGAAAGAGAGTAGAAMTGNQEVVLPAESAVSFKLSKPLQI